MYFADNPRELIEAYVESGEGLTVAGGFAIQVFVWLDSSLFSYIILTRVVEVPWFGKWMGTTTMLSAFLLLPFSDF